MTFKSAFDKLTVENNEESEVIIIMRVSRTEIVIKYCMMTSVCVL